MSSLSSGRHVTNEWNELLQRILYNNIIFKIYPEGVGGWVKFMRTRVPVSTSTIQVALVGGVTSGNASVRGRWRRWCVLSRVVFDIMQQFSNYR